MARYGLLVLLLKFAVIDKLNTGVQSTTSIYRLGPCPFVKRASCPDKDNVRFFLYTRSTFEDGELVDIETDISNTKFDPTVPTKILVHGYFVGYNSTNFRNIKEAYLAYGAYNVFAMDYGRLSPGPEICYPFAVYNAPHAGRCLAQFIQWLRVAGVRDLHVVGFSLGAHVAGFAATNLRPYVLPRITGLDPAKPFFITILNDNKLDASDAVFVDVIHTNAAFQGVIEQSGHVDFYVNGGSYQPGCGSFVEGFWSGCHHNRAALYFAESVNISNGFWGWECSGHLLSLLGRCPPTPPGIRMGEHVSHNSRGFVIVPTRGESPFALGTLHPQKDLELIRLPGPIQLNEFPSHAFLALSPPLAITVPVQFPFPAPLTMPVPVPVPWNRIRTYLSQLRRHNIDTDLLI